MEPRLIALRLFLNQLEVSSEINTLADRVRVQKAVYLGQLSGVDLGYRFGWYLRGPYCTRLTKDYFEIEEAIELEEDDYKNMELKSSIKKKLDKVSPVLKKPASVDLEYEEWLELVASYHYLRKIRECSEKEARAVLENEKPHLVRFMEIADTRLKEIDLIS